MRYIPIAFLALLTACVGESSKATPPAEDVPTYRRDIRPITQVHCNSCHTAGGIAPFPLDSFAAARDRASDMVAAVATGRMPPWPASPDCGGPFVGDKSLSSAQKELLARWAATGASEGVPVGAEPSASLPATLKQVDFEGRMEAPYTATAQDDYRCFMIDPDIQSGQVVTGYDIVPGAREVVHHVILYVADRSVVAQQDAADAGPGWQCFGGPGVASTGALGAWAPGSEAVLFPDGTGIPLSSSQVLVMQVHYNTLHGEFADQTAVRLMYGTGAEQRGALVPMVGSDFRVPPGATGYSYTKTVQNDRRKPVALWGFLPHMHTHGRSIRMSTTATNTCLVDIPRWDFHWQYQYYRQQPHILPAGEGVALTCVWDNPTDRELRWGEGTTDEMCFAFVYVTDVSRN